MFHSVFLVDNSSVASDSVASEALQKGFLTFFHNLLKVSEDTLKGAPSQGSDNTSDPQVPPVGNSAATESKDDVLDKKVIYKSSMKNFYIISFIIAVLAVLLIRSGILMISGRGDIIEPDVIILASVPILLAIVSLCVIIISYYRFRNRTITLTPVHLTYDNGHDKPVNMAWKDFQTATETKQTKSPFDYTVISDGKTSFLVERFFFPKYDKLCADIKTVRRLAKKQGLFI